MKRVLGKNSSGRCWLLILCLVIFPIGQTSEADELDKAWQAVDLLPDMIVRESDLYDNDIVTDIEPGRVHLRLANGTANIGDGKLYVWGVTPDNGDGTQDVMQRIFRDDSTWWDRMAGRFVFHQGHSHVHFENWAAYRIREVLDSNGVGPILAESAKISFCLLDLAVYDSSLPNFDPDGEFHSCGSTVQGISVGWIDIYGKYLPGQNIDITDIPDGTYWLESEVDPKKLVMEKDENNNITRILVTIGAPAEINPDAYEPNDDPAETDGRPAGGPNSPNLGPCNPVRVVDSLTIHESNNEDYFKFYSNHVGSSSDFVRIEFIHGLGDLDLRLLNSAQVQVGASNGVGNQEEISLAGRPEGWYYIRVFGYNGATNPYYMLTVDPPSNNPPEVTTVEPSAGDTAIILGIETFTVTWTYTDPESDQCWVSVWLNELPEFDGQEYLDELSLHTDAALGFYVINTAYLEEDYTYWIYCQITDGGTTTGDWSEGTFTIVEQPGTGAVAGQIVDEELAPIEGVVVSIESELLTDSTDADGRYIIPGLHDGLYDVAVAHAYYRDTLVVGVTVADGDTTSLDVVLAFECPYVAGDANADQSGPDVADLTYLVDYLFNGGPAPPLPSAADVDGSGGINVADVSYMVDYLFNGGPAPQCPVVP